MDYYKLQCPYCGATLEVEDGLETFFCKYCGGKVILTGQNEEVLRYKIRTKEKDEAVDRELRKKELEYQFNKKVKNETEKKEKKILFNLVKFIIIYTALFVLLFNILTKNESSKYQKNAEEYLAIQELMNDGKYNEAFVRINGYSVYDWGEQGSEWVDRFNSLRQQIEEKMNG